MSLQRWLRLAFWAAVVFTFVIATLPRPPDLPAGDKVQHIVAFMTLMGLAAAAYSRTSILQLALGMAAFGALIEVAQMVPALNRDAELMDWIADVAAVIVTLLVMSLGRRLWRRT